MGQIYLLALVLLLASTLAILVKRFKQPLIVSYVAAGAILSAFHIVRPEQLQFLAILPEIGLALLLFLVGMELDLQGFKSLGKNIVILAVGQVAFTTVVLFVILSSLGFSSLTSLLVGCALSFSSTILVVKLLVEGKDLVSLHGKLAVGILLLEDLLAVLVLMLISLSGGQRGPDFTAIVFVVLKGLALIWLAIFSMLLCLMVFITTRGVKPILNKPYEKVQECCAPMVISVLAYFHQVLLLLNLRH